MIYQVDWQPVGRRIKVPEGRTLLEAAQAAGVELVSVCGGGGTCRGCLVRLAEGTLSPLTLEEQANLEDEDIRGGYRLACQARPTSDVIIDIPPESLTTPQRLQIEDIYEIKSNLTSTFPVTGFGLAFDIGTTKIAGFLVELASGRTLARTGQMNPQIAYGEDVIARIVYCNENQDGRNVLHDRLLEILNRMITNLCAEAQIQPLEIVDIVVVGNTVMHHLFAGLPVQQLGTAPYLPAVTEAMTLKASDVGFALPVDIPVYLPPNIAGYVGADHVAVWVATEMAQSDQTIITLDIGTNTEVGLVHQGHFLSCSCASGPAFEGAHIRDGMRAAPGAIERVRIDGAATDHISNPDHRWQVQVHTIGNQPAVGICGSGILDAVAELIKVDAIDYTGNFLVDHSLELNSLIRKASNGRRECLLVPADRTGHGRDLVVNRKDINEIQLAKGAIRTGVEILLNDAGIQDQDIDLFIIAGAFGTYLDLESAIRIGMFPDLPRSRYLQVGNAAGAGARQMLVSLERRRMAEAISHQINYVELTTHPKFTETFVREILFKEK
jgi:uncharacterized 2Fe-2S/4Fe-4S cluster protein (DUF4445 family)